MKAPIRDEILYGKILFLAKEQLLSGKQIAARLRIKLSKVLNVIRNYKIVYLPGGGSRVFRRS